MAIAETQKRLLNFNAGVQIIHTDFMYSTNGYSKNNKKLVSAKGSNVCTNRPSHAVNIFLKQIRPQVFVAINC